jgi:hypothetical protein
MEQPEIGDILLNEQRNYTPLPSKSDPTDFHMPPERSVGQCLPESSLRETRCQEIKAYVETNVLNSTIEDKQRLIDETVELYDKAKEMVAPVIAAFAHHLLQSISGKGKDHKVVFIARDSLGTYRVAQALLAKFPDKYPGISSQQLVYAYLTRKVVWNSPRTTITEYLKQLGINNTDKVIYTDIGMYGATIDTLNNLPISVINHQYLISCTPRAKGFLYEQYGDNPEKRMSVFRSIVGNPAVHFMEDTFAGLIQSPTALVKTELGLEPNTKEMGYPPDIAVKRQFALRALEDYIPTMISPEVDIKAAREKLNTFLSDTTNYKHIMVPHER